jgi:hypothetical protein
LHAYGDKPAICLGALGTNVMYTSVMSGCNCSTYRFCSSLAKKKKRKRVGSREMQKGREREKGREEKRREEKRGGESNQR